MNISETAAAIRATRIEINNTRESNQIRLTYLSDKLWDLTARYNMLMRVSGLEAV